VSNFKLCVTPEEHDAAIRWACAQPVVACDTETTGLAPWAGDRIIGASFGVPGTAFYLATSPDGKRGAPGLEERLRPLMESTATRKVWQNFAFDAAFLLKAGIKPANVDDVMIMAAIQDERRLSPFSRRGVGLDKLAHELLGEGKGLRETRVRSWVLLHGPEALGLSPREAAAMRNADTAWKAALRVAPLELVAEYACMDADLPLRIEAKLREAGVPRVYDAVERPLLIPVAEMSARPKHIDVAYAAELAERCRVYEELSASLCGGINPHAHGQVRDFLNGLGVEIEEETASGDTSTNEAALLDVMGVAPVAWHILEARKARKIRTTYAERLVREAARSGLAIFPRFKQASTQTGRFSSSDPNAQNWPRGPVVRRMIQPPPGRVFVLADYAQIEPRLMAHFSGDERMIAAFRNGIDIYGTMATSGVFPFLIGRDPNTIKKTHPIIRNACKTGGLACFYGAHGRKLRQIFAKQASWVISDEEANRFRDGIWNGLREVGNTVRRLTAKARADGKMVNPWGRVRHFDGRGGAAHPNDAFNNAVQGTAADMLKRAMLRCCGMMGKYGACMTATIHDEIVFDFPADGDLDGFVRELKHTLEDGWPFKVPLLAEISVARDNWASKQEILL